MLMDPGPRRAGLRIRGPTVCIAQGPGISVGGPAYDCSENTILTKGEQERGVELDGRSFPALSTSGYPPFRELEWPNASADAPPISGAGGSGLESRARHRRPVEQATCKPPTAKPPSITQGDAKNPNTIPFILLTVTGWPMRTFSRRIIMRGVKLANKRELDRVAKLRWETNREASHNQTLFSLPAKLAPSSHSYAGLETGVPRGHGGSAVRLLASRYGEPDLIPGRGQSGFTQVGIVPDDAAGRRVFLGISRFPCPCIPALLLTHFVSPSSTLKTLLLRAAQMLSPILRHCGNYTATSTRNNIVGFVRRADICSRLPGELEDTLCSCFVFVLCDSDEVSCDEMNFTRDQLCHGRLAAPRITSRVKSHDVFQLNRMKAVAWRSIRSKQLTIRRRPNWFNAGLIGDRSGDLDGQVVATVPRVVCCTLTKVHERASSCCRMRSGVCRTNGRNWGLTTSVTCTPSTGVRLVKSCISAARDTNHAANFRAFMSRFNERLGGLTLFLWT
ncbi:hypothetical protein PR048_032058 [Dryococelus australis]|uniref:Uncharacterized protein n=1 Tax=Dryococelus australis TaxID=614101 RepID=A0ABQ9G145_9NEOP|nr:hypothetical protein PR048_032058 [Dryococelus australis]